MKPWNGDMRHLAKNLAISHLRALRTRWLRTVGGQQKITFRTTAPLTEFSQEGRQTFFGYYDITPFSQDERLILANVAPLENRTPHRQSILKIGYFQLEGEERKEFREVGTTNTWCWQQGCRLQWFPRLEGYHVIYNKMVNGNYGSIIQNLVSGQEIRTFPYPIYALSPDGRWALSVNFSRLQRLRPGYGYAVLADTTAGEPAPRNDGIWILDLENGQSRLIISLDQMAEWAAREQRVDKEAHHYFNHLAFNPNGNRFVFFHIWNDKDRRSIRMITADKEGKNVRLLENKYRISHFAWTSNEALVVSAENLGSGSGYYRYMDREVAERSPIGNNALTEDGHPSHSPDGRYLLTDTYPDKLGNQHLILFENGTGRCRIIGSFFRPYHLNGEWRCDLHPRWSPTGKYLSIDSAHTGKRSLCVIDLVTEQKENQSGFFDSPIL